MLQRLALAACLCASASALAISSPSNRLAVVYPLSDLASFEAELASAAEADSLMVVKYAAAHRTHLSHARTAPDIDCKISTAGFGLLSFPLAPCPCCCDRRFARPNCRSCLALAPKFEAMAKAQPQRRLFEVNERQPSARKICKAEKLEALPTVAVYRDGECVLKKIIKVKEWEEVVTELDELDADSRGI